MIYELCIFLSASAVSGYTVHAALPSHRALSPKCPGVALPESTLACRVRPAFMQAAATAVPEHKHATSGDGQKKKIVVLGGDGFCGWPSAVHLSDKGHEVIIIDNLSRRKIDVELGCASLTPIVSPEERVAAWHEITGKTIRYEYMDIALEYDRFTQFLKEEEPDTIVHFAEQRAAPYSMRNAACKR